MNTRSYLYVAAVTITAIGLTFSLPWTDVAQITTREWLGLGTFVGLCLLGEAMAVDYSIGPNRTAKSSMAYLPLLACAAVYPPQLAILVSATFAGLTQVFLRG